MSRNRVNPLLKPLKSVLLVLRQFSRIPGFHSESVAKALSEGDEAVANAYKPKKKNAARARRVKL